MKTNYTTVIVTTRAGDELLAIAVINAATIVSLNYDAVADKITINHATGGKTTLDGLGPRAVAVVQDIRDAIECANQR